jgi:hypothetical protein
LDRYTISEGGGTLPVGPEAAISPQQGGLHSATPSPYAGEGAASGPTGRVPPPSLTMCPVDPKKENARLIQSAAMSAENSLMSQFCIEFFALKKSTEMSLGAPASYNLPNPLPSSPFFHRARRY